MPLLDNQGGPVQAAALTLVPVFYGDWSEQDPRVELTRTLLDGLASTSLWNVVRKYTSGNGRVTGSMIAAPAVFPNLTYGMDWGEQDYAGLIAADAVPPPADGSAGIVAVVIASPGVRAPGLGTRFCGYHSVQIWGQPYIFIGDPTNDASCRMRGRTQTLNTAPLLVHEVVELVTDPLLNAWVGANMTESGDLCAWTLVPLPGAPTGFYETDGVRWNLNVSGTLFLTQSIWDPVTRECSMGAEDLPISAPAPAPAPAPGPEPAQAPLVAPSNASANAPPASSPAPPAPLTTPVNASASPPPPHPVAHPPVHPPLAQAKAAANSRSFCAGSPLGAPGTRSTADGRGRGGYHPSRHFPFRIDVRPPILHPEEDVAQRARRSGTGRADGARADGAPGAVRAARASGHQGARARGARCVGGVFGARRIRVK